MPFMFNPCAPCCKGRILVYTQFQEFPQIYDGMQAMYVSNGYRCDLSNPDTSIEKYRLIFMIMETDQDAWIAPSIVATWLSKGNRRLVITGEFGPTYDASSAWANGYLSALGVPMSCVLGTLNNGGIGCDTIPSPTSALMLPHYLTSDISIFSNSASSTVSGGTALTDYIGATSLAIYKLGNSEVLLSGDSNCFGGQCAYPDMNTQFLLNLISMPVQ